MARVRKLGEVLGDDEPEPKPKPQPAPPATRPPAALPPRKFTMLMDDEAIERANRVTSAVVALSGIRATKSMRAEVVRALFEEAEHDRDLQQRLAERVRRAVEES